MTASRSYFSGKVFVRLIQGAISSSGTHHLTAIFLIGALYSSLPASTLFSDDFSDEGRSNLNWTVVAENDQPLRFQQGHAVLENKSSIYVAFAMHTLGRKPPAITVSGRIISDIPGAGLFYCNGKEGGVYSGYAVIIGDRELLVIEYGTQGEKELLIRKCPFLLPGNNMLSISSGNGRIGVFCNSYFQFSFPNPLGSAGDLAIVVPPLSTISFDDVSVVDTIADSVTFDPFRDPLKANRLWGWSLSGSGNYNIDTVGLHLHTAAGQQVYAGIIVPLAGFRMSVILRDGNRGGGKPFGFVLFGRGGDKGDSIVPAYRFGIMASGNALVEKRSVAGWETLTGGTFSGHYSGEWDSLALWRRGSVCSFIVNAAEVASVGGMHMVAAGGGLFVAESLSVSFRNFSLYDRSDEPLKVGRGEIVLWPDKLLFEGYVFDLLGRRAETAPERFFTEVRYTPSIMVFPSGRKCVMGKVKH